MKGLLGILILDRPKTVEMCLQHLLKTNSRNEFNIILIDNHSNEQTQEVLKKYEKDVDEIIHNEWNVGYCFGVNQWMSRREPGQHCVEVDSDLVLKSPDWWEMARPILEDEDIGEIAARRPSAWIDREDKRQGYKDLHFEKRHGHWLEMPHSCTTVAPLTVYSGELLDRIGFHNEASGWGDMDIGLRIKLAGLKAAYIPDIFLYHLDNDFEIYDHPQRGAHRELLSKNVEINRQYIARYLHYKQVYCGTRWLPETIADDAYKTYSDTNWEFHRTWGIK